MGSSLTTLNTNTSTNMRATGATSLGTGMIGASMTGGDIPVTDFAKHSFASGASIPRAEGGNMKGGFKEALLKRASQTITESPISAASVIEVPMANQVTQLLNQPE